MHLYVYSPHGQDSMHEVIFELRGEGEYTAATKQTGLAIEVWCNNHCDLLRVQGTNAKTILDHVAGIVGVQETLETSDELLIITKDCLMAHTANSVVNFTNQHNCLLLPPIRYRNGAKYCRVVALNSEDLTEFYQSLCETYTVSVLSKKDFTDNNLRAPLLSSDELLPDLSPRQREVLLKAHELGY